MSSLRSGIGGYMLLGSSSLERTALSFLFPPFCQLSSRRLVSVRVLLSYFLGIIRACDISLFYIANAKAQLLTVPPYAVSAIVLIILSYFSDRFQSRGIPLSCAASIGAIGYL